MRKALIVTLLSVLAGACTQPQPVYPQSAYPPPPPAPYGGPSEVSPPSASSSEGEARAEAQDIFDRSFIVFEDEYAAFISVHDYGYAAYGTVTTTRWGVPIRGVQRERLSSVEFYRGVGRADLADAYESRYGRKRMVGLASISSLGLSVVLAGVAFSKVLGPPGWDHCDVFDPNFSACVAEGERQDAAKEAEAKKWGIGAGVAFVGAFALGAVYRSMNPHPSTESERRVMAHDYNERLRRQLRLPRQTQRFSLSPFVTGEGTGLLAAGRF